MSKFWQSFRPPSRAQRKQMVSRLPTERAQVAALGLLTRMVVGAIALVSWPLALYDFLKRNATVRTAIFLSAIVLSSIGLAFGTAALLGIVGIAVKFATAAFYMIFQFLVLFTFMSNTKTLEVFPGDKRMVTFEKDYFGNEYLVGAVRQWVHSLTLDGKKKLDKMGAESITGLLLEGPPGTGKTLLAQALAGDTHAAFFGLTGSDFRAMFWGVGEMKVMGIYRKARKAARRYGAAVIFLDEFDSIAQNRGGVSGSQGAPASTGGMFSGGTGVASKLLVELDGVRVIGRRDQLQNAMRKWLSIPPIIQPLVLTIGATNRLTAIDPAFLRPGRMDKIIKVDPPDKGSRRKIIEGYLSKVKHAPGIDIERLTEDTAGVTPATIMSAIRRGAPRYALNDGRDEIGEADILHALQEDLVGLANPIADFDPQQKMQVAIHEAGHAVASWALLPKRRITHVSIIRRGSGILGYMQSAEAIEKYSYPLSELSARTMVALAGHIATDIVLEEPWSGGSMDFDMVRIYMRSLAAMGQFGGIPFDMTDPLKQKHIAENADRWLNEIMAGTEKLIKRHRGKLDELVEALMVEDELSSERTYSILGKEQDNE